VIALSQAEATEWLFVAWRVLKGKGAGMPSHAVLLAADFVDAGSAARAVQAEAFELRANEWRAIAGEHAAFESRVYGFCAAVLRSVEAGHG
jgi:hypothetical protein